MTDTLVPNVQGQIDDISALGIPEGDQDTVNPIEASQKMADAAKALDFERAAVLRDRIRELESEWLRES